MPSISLPPFPPVAARAARRLPSTQPPSLAANPPPSPAAASDDKVSIFRNAVAEFTKYPPSRQPNHGFQLRRNRSSSLHALMTAFARAGEADEVRRLFRQLKRRHPNPNVFCYNTLLNSLVVANRLDEVEAVFAEMIASGLVPTAASYSILIKLQSFHPKHIDLAYEIMRSMLQSGCKPDSVTCSTLIASLCRAGRIQEAWGVLDMMIEEKCVPTVRAYTCIVHGYCLEGRVEEAKRLVETMGSLCCPPDTVTYSILIKALCEVGDFGEVEKVMGDSVSKGWKPNAITYNIYMNGLCKYGMVNEAFKQLEVMRRSGLLPDVVTLNILFDCLCCDAKVWEAKCLLERSFELDWDIDVFFYNTLMSRLCELGEWLPILILLTNMVKKGVSPDIFTFTIVIHSLCRAGKLCGAKFIFTSMGFVPDVVAFNTLLHGHYMAGESDEVRLLFANMVAENINPNKFTYGIMIDSLCQGGHFLEAIGYFLMSLKDGYFPVAVTRLAKWLVKRGKLKELLMLLDEILGRGLVLNVLTFNSLIRAFCKKGFCQSAEFYKVCLILDKMLGIK